MIRQIAIPLAVLCCLALLVQTAYAGPKDEVVPSYEEINGPGSRQIWYLTNLNQQKAIKCTVSVLDDGRRKKDIIVVVPPGQSQYIGRRQADDHRSWQIVSARYQ